MPTLGQLAGGKQKNAPYQLEPGMRDIYDYLSNQGNSAFFYTPNETSGGEAGMGNTGHVPWETVTSGGGDNASSSQVPGVDERFRDVVSFLPNSANGEGSSGYASRVDDTKLPQTRFGGVNMTAPVTANTPLYNPNMVYNDPNFGLITDHRNVKPDQVNNMASQAILAAMMGGIGMLAAPAAVAGGGLFGGTFNPASLGIGAVNAARGLANGGDWMSILSSLGGSVGVPEWATTLAQLAGHVPNLGGKG